MNRGRSDPGRKRISVMGPGENETAGRVSWASQRWLEFALGAARAGIWDWDIQTGKVKWSENLEAIHGLSRGAFGGTFADFLAGIHPEDRAIVGRSITHAVEQAADLHIEYRIIWPDGGIHWMEGRGRPVHDKTGRPVRMLGVCLDITERRRVEEALSESEERYRKLVETSPDAIVLADLETNILIVNGQALSLMGYSNYDDIVGKPSLSFIEKSCHQRFLENVRKTLDLGSLKDVEYQLVRSDGGIITVEVNASVVTDMLGRPEAFLATVRDTTERKRVEEALRESEELYRKLVETCPDAIVLTDLEINILMVNNRMLELFGYSRSEDVVGESVLAFVDPSDRQRALDHARKLLEGGRLKDIEFTLIRSDGTPFTGEVNASLIVDPSDQPKAFLGTVRDITERRRMEEALRESEELYRKLVETCPDAIVLTGLDSTILMANEQAAILYGASSVAELLGRNGFEFVVPEDRPRAIADTAECATSKIIRNREYRFFRRDGSTFPAETSFSVVVDAEGRPKAFISMGRDITERKRAEEQIGRRNRELAALNAVAAAVSGSLELPEMLTALEGVIVEQLEVPGGAIFFYDESSDRLDLQAAWGLPQVMVAALRSTPVAGSHNERVVRDNETVLRTGPHAIEPRLALALGVDVSHPGWQSYLSVPLSAKGEVQGVLGLFGEAPTAFDNDHVAFFKAVGQEIGIALYNARLFEQVRAGRQRLQDLSRRLVEVQETERRHLARELHDEIGQDLTGLKIALAMAARAPAEECKAMLDDAQQLVDRIMTRVRDLSLDLRPTMLDDLGLLPALLWHFERYTAQTGIRVNFEHAGLGERLPPPVETAAYRIIQEALTNVARHAAVDEATVRLWAGSGVLGIQIIDRGMGFDPETPRAAGTTGGLSGMSERVSLLGGQLRVESRRGAGTRVVAELPLTVLSGRDAEGG